MNAKQILIAILAVVAITLVVTFYMKKYEAPIAPASQVAQTATTTNSKPAPGILAVSQYITANIAALSSVKPEEGKRLTVGKMRLSSATGTVDFSDGKTSYVADFSYAIDQSGKVAVTKFTIKK